MNKESESEWAQMIKHKGKEGCVWGGGGGAQMVKHKGKEGCVCGGGGGGAQMVKHKGKKKGGGGSDDQT